MYLVVFNMFLVLNFNSLKLHLRFKFDPIQINFSGISILGDPGADSGGEGKSKRATKKIGEEKSRALVLDFSLPIFSFPI